MSPECSKIVHVEHDKPLSHHVYHTVLADNALQSSAKVLTGHCRSHRHQLLSVLAGFWRLLSRAGCAGHCCGWLGSDYAVACQCWVRSSSNSFIMHAANASMLGLRQSM